MRIVIPILLLLLGVGAGIGAGLFLGGSTDLTVASADDGHGDEGHGDDTAGDDHATGTDDHSGGHDDGAANTGATEYVRLNNQFIVPIVHHGTVRSLVVMSLTIEVDSGENSAVFTREPRLRDAFLQVMFAHANAGGFDGSFTEAGAMAPLREALWDSAHQILGDIMHEVLIVDITRQDA